jgi:hypothetical protein
MLYRVLPLNHSANLTCRDCFLHVQCTFHGSYNKQWTEDSSLLDWDVVSIGKQLPRFLKVVVTSESGSLRKVLPVKLHTRTNLTPWSRVHREKLIRHNVLKKFPEFYGTRRFITAFKRARHLFLSWARSIQSRAPVVSSHLRPGLPSGLFLSGFPTKIRYAPLLFYIRATCPTHLSLLEFVTRIISGKEYSA